MEDSTRAYSLVASGNALTIRARTCDGPASPGIEETRDWVNEGVISEATSLVAISVIRKDEEQMIAKTA